MSVTFDITPEKRATQLSFLQRQLFRETPAVTRAEADLAGQTAIVTGANTGLGLESARQLLDLGLSRLIIAVRSVSKGEAAKEELVGSLKSFKTGSLPTIDVWALDLSEYDSITAFAGKCKTLDRLDLVINNAGISKKSFQPNPKTGYDEVIQTNYVGAALLTLLLLPLLKEKNTTEKPGRFVLVNSETSAWAAFKERNYPSGILAGFKSDEGYVAQDRYWSSKLLGQLFLTELARRVPASVAIVNAPNPGLCRTSLMREWDGNAAGFIISILMRAIGRTTEVGARAFTDAAVRHGVRSHGQYLEDGKLQP
jgi:NAD(P)-dependent dehydrogenase (short-subunit alcohol dehydrogenase family)